MTDGVAGITRRRAGKGWTFLGPGGVRISDPAERRRINSLVIPPAWTDVWISPDPKGHIQVTARDARGRKQYRYHAGYRDARDQSKFRHMLELSDVLPAIRERAERDLRAPELSRRQILATVVQLLDKTLIRVGNDEYARENRSYGLTTLRMQHVQVNGSKLSFNFRGKSGVQHAISVTDRRVARIVQRCQDLPGQELFQYLNSAGKRETVTSDDVNTYLREICGRSITAKDFRTWGGTMLAGVELRGMGAASTHSEAKRNIIRAAMPSPSALAIRDRFAASTTFILHWCMPICKGSSRARPQLIRRGAIAAGGRRRLCAATKWRSCNFCRKCCDCAASPGRWHCRWAATAEIRLSMDLSLI